MLFVSMFCVVCESVVFVCVCLTLCKGVWIDFNEDFGCRYVYGLVVQSSGVV